mmetsp:Transcript_18037/g.58376  ORF Transcript_18037/g.58376 Transcript_18037/m.58376 type:complete len:245 (+) Transcript_18037:224-958(+)
MKTRLRGWRSTSGTSGCPMQCTRLSSRRRLRTRKRRMLATRRSGRGVLQGGSLGSPVRPPRTVQVEFQAGFQASPPLARAPQGWGCRGQQRRWVGLQGRPLTSWKRLCTTCSTRSSRASSTSASSIWRSTATRLSGGCARASFRWRRFPRGSCTSSSCAFTSSFSSTRFASRTPSCWRGHCASTCPPGGSLAPLTKSARPPSSRISTPTRRCGTGWSTGCSMPSSQSPCGTTGTSGGPTRRITF